MSGFAQLACGALALCSFHIVWELFFLLSGDDLSGLRGEMRARYCYGFVGILVYLVARLSGIERRLPGRNCFPFIGII